MHKVLWWGCFVLLLNGTATGAPEPSAPPGAKWEYKAIAFSDDPTGATRLLNELQTAGWEYVGPLAHGLVAFRRPALSAVEVAAKEELDRLQGTWNTVSTELDGQQRVEEKKLEKIIINGNRWTAKLDGEVSQEGVFKVIDKDAKFIKIDFTVTEGFKQGETWLSIVQVDGDKMRWNGCMVGDTKTRPKAMATGDGDGFFLRTLKRDK